MDRQSPRPGAWSRLWLTMWAAALLAACQGFSEQFPMSDQPPDPAMPSWRVVERLGEARYLAPSMAGWEQVVAGGMIPAGSQISTGIGGRLIVGQGVNQLNAGTRSRFILPAEVGGSVQQTAGWLRYRIAGAGSTSFVIKTPFLDLLVADAVLDVTVADRETEVAVVSGRVRVKSLDGRRQIDLHAGYTGYASLEGNPLALRRGPHQALEVVPPTVIPALHPDRGPDAAQSLSVAASIGATATAPVAVPRPAMVAIPAAVVDGPASAPVRAAAPEVALAPTPEAVLANTSPAAPQAVSQPSEASAPEQADQIRQRFDRLTEGLLDGLLPAPSPNLQRDGR